MKKDGGVEAIGVVDTSPIASRESDRFRSNFCSGNLNIKRPGMMVLRSLGVPYLGRIASFFSVLNAPPYIPEVTHLP